MKKYLIIILCAIILIPAAYIGAQLINSRTSKTKVNTSHKQRLKVYKYHETTSRNSITDKKDTPYHGEPNKDRTDRDNTGSSIGVKDSSDGSTAITKPSKDISEGRSPDKTLLAILGTIPGKYSIGIKDLNTGKETFVSSPGITETTKMRSASIIKLFIMAEAFKQIKDGKISYSAENKNLLEDMITKSDNTATNTLIDRLGMENVNKTARLNGFTSSILKRKMLDYKSLKAGVDNYTSSKDVINLYTKLINRELINSNFSDMMLGILKRQKINTKIPVLLPRGTVIAHKTGELPPDSSLDLGGVENDAGIVFGPKGNYIISFLMSDLPDTAEARKVIQDISKSVYEYYSKL